MTYLCDRGQHLFAGYFDVVACVFLPLWQWVNGGVQALGNVRAHCPNTIQYTGGKRHDRSAERDTVYWSST